MCSRRRFALNSVRNATSFFIENWNVNAIRHKLKLRMRHRFSEISFGKRLKQIKAVSSGNPAEIPKVAQAKAMSMNDEGPNRI
jgi:hypothetical protein